MRRSHSDVVLAAIRALVLAVALTPLVAAAQQPPPPPVPLQLADVTPKTAGLGDELRVRVVGLPQKIVKEKFDPQTLVLSIGGRSLPNLPVRLVADDVLAFDLKRTDATREAWTALLGRPSSPERRNVPVRLLLGGTFVETPVPARAVVTLRVYHAAALWWSTIGILVVLGLFVWLAIKSNIIRDAAPPNPPAPKRRPYSLARFQMAVWFFVVVGAFLFLYAITLTYDTITPQALILIGIGIGTALGAAVIDTNKRAGADVALATLEPQHARLTAELAGLKAIADGRAAAVTAAGAVATEAERLAAATAQADHDEKAAQLAAVTTQIADAKAGLTQPVSEHFLLDVLTDASGVSFHRFQMFVWTLVLALVFCISVWDALAMPTFSETLLVLMGISGGTYLGFKVPERQQ